ncbi:MAG: hypothetical protein KGL53_16155, partial [Elusimicrobia bacterium]|nr:hypothetical protein [Elusimicrobiota bacterium]
PHGLGVDLVLEARPFTFAQWRRRRTIFTADGTKLPCGALDMLLAAKKAAGRPKDRAFLKVYAASSGRAGGGGRARRTRIYALRARASQDCRKAGNPERGMK